MHSRFLPDPEDDHPGSCPAAPRGPPTQGLTLCHAGTTARPGPPRGLSYPPPPPQAATVSFGDDWSFLPSSAESPLCASSGEPSLVQSEHQAQAGTTEPLPLSSALAPPPPPPASTCSHHSAPATCSVSRPSQGTGPASSQPPGLGKKHRAAGQVSAGVCPGSRPSDVLAVLLRPLGWDEAGAVQAGRTGGGGGLGAGVGGAGGRKGGE